MPAARRPPARSVDADPAGGLPCPPRDLAAGDRAQARHDLGGAELRFRALRAPPARRGPRRRRSLFVGAGDERRGAGGAGGPAPIRRALFAPRVRSPRADARLRALRGLAGGRLYAARARSAHSAGRRARAAVGRRPAAGRRRRPARRSDLRPRPVGDGRLLRQSGRHERGAAGWVARHRRPGPRARRRALRVGPREGPRHPARKKPCAAGVRGRSRRARGRPARLLRGGGLRGGRGRGSRVARRGGRRGGDRADPCPRRRAHRRASSAGPSARSRDPPADLEREAPPRRGAAPAPIGRAAPPRSPHPAARREGDRALAPGADRRLMLAVAIAGGGPAGLASAIRSAQRGYRTVLFERAAGGPDKACGEGLMPSGARELERLGARIPQDASAPFRGIRYLQEDGTVLEARFGSRQGIGIRRTALAQALRDRAVECGAELRQGSIASAVARPGAVELATDAGPLEARLLIAADGLHSPLRRAAGLEVPAPDARKRYGIRRHFNLAPWTDLVEVHWAEGIEAYVTPVGPRTVNVAFLLERSEPADFSQLLERFPRLRPRASAPAESAVR